MNWKKHKIATKKFNFRKLLVEKSNEMRVAKKNQMKKKNTNKHTEKNILKYVSLYN